MRGMLDDRARLLLKTLIERYIADGQPVDDFGGRHAPQRCFRFVRCLQEAGRRSSDCAGRADFSDRTM